MEFQSSKTAYFMYNIMYFVIPIHYSIIAFI